MIHPPRIRFSLLSLATLAASLPVAVSDQASAQRRSRARASGMEHFTFQTERFNSDAMGRRIRYGVYLPKGHDDVANSKKTYPWAIWLHGMRGSLYKFKDNGASILDSLRKAKSIPDMILVTPSVGSMPLYINGGKDGDTEDMVLQELWGDVEKKFRVSKARHERAIMGVSMGALGAMKMALRFPQKFGSVAVHSGPVLPADPEEMSGRFKRYGEFMRIDTIFGNPIDKKKWAKEIPAALVLNKPSKIFAGLRIYFDAGSNDRYRFGPPNQEFSKLLKKRGIKHTFNYVQGGGHAWGSGSIQKQMRVSLPFVAAGFKNQPAAKTPGKKTAKPEKR